MLKKIFFVFSAFFLFSAQSFAQRAAPKVLVVVHSDIENQLNFNMAILRILELKNNGVEVRALFEGESVLYFLGRDVAQTYRRPAPDQLPAGAPPPPARHRSDETPEVQASTPTVITGELASFTGSPKLQNYELRTYMLDASVKKVHGEEGQILLKLPSAGIPYTLCAFSATLLGAYDKLKGLGLPLSGDPVNPVGLASFINDGYQIVVY